MERRLGRYWRIQTVRVLVGATFPGVIGRGKVNEGAGCILNLALAMKLGAVVCGDGVKGRPRATD
jgi:hypothetical protein